MNEERKTINVAVTGIAASVVILGIILFIGFKQIANSIENKVFGGSYLNSPATITTIDINNKDFLTDYEASEYLGISWEALITLVKNGSYSGNYLVEYYNELNTTYIFPREELKNWFTSYIKDNSSVRADSSLFPEKTEID